MDLAELKRRYDRSREIEVEALGGTFVLRLPPRPLAALIVETEQAFGSAVYRLLLHSVADWRGITAGAVDPDSPAYADPLPFSTQALELLLDRHPAVAITLSAALLEGCQRRNEALEAARKN